MSAGNDLYHPQIIKDILPDFDGGYHMWGVVSEDEEPPEETEDPIVPSEVYESWEIADEGTLEFYGLPEKGLNRKFLGKRYLDKREEIYDHIKKTKRIKSVDSDPDNKRIYIHWEEK